MSKIWVAVVWSHVPYALRALLDILPFSLATKVYPQPLLLILPPPHCPESDLPHSRIRGRRGGRDRGHDRREDPLQDNEAYGHYDRSCFVAIQTRTEMMAVRVET